MKYLLYLLAAMYIIGGYYVINVFFVDKNIDIEKIKESIVIIVPEQELISYKNNPEGLFEEYKNSGIGAGFFISNDGQIQTVNHIIEDDKINYKIIYNNEEYNSEVISRNKEKDLAILKITTENSKLFPILNKEGVRGWSDGEEIISFGVNPENLEIIYNTGTIINKKSKLENMSNLLEISNILKPGFSGGPIINKKGEVIGINYAISEGKNYGISF